jgi:single-stranded DNA-binding protein
VIDGIVSGRLFGAAQSRVGRNGSEFVTAKVRAAAGDGEALFVNVIAFSHSAGAALMALADGDSVALAGTLTPKAWVDKQGDAKPALDMTVHVVTTAYHVTRKRKAVADASTCNERSAREPAMTDDALDF